MQGCDKIAVIDGASKLVMRYIDVGTLPNTEGPHSVRFSKDGRYAFTCFKDGEYVQKIDAATDKIIQQVHIGPGSWNIVCPSPDGNMALVTDVANAKVTLVNFTKGTTYGNTGFKQPHGIIAANDSFRSFYITSESSNGLHKLTFIDTNYRFTKTTNVPLENGGMILVSKYDPHEVMLSPDGSKLFATCSKSNEVRILNTKNDSLVTGIPAVISVGAVPQEMAISHKQPYLFVTCADDLGTIVGNVQYKGSVYVINYNTHIFRNHMV
jgi:DNA-binding beta-propeller fold protein YncE